jgi:hypothetical protein
MRSKSWDRGRNSQIALGVRLRIISSGLEFFYPLRPERMYRRFLARYYGCILQTGPFPPWGDGLALIFGVFLCHPRHSSQVKRATHKNPFGLGIVLATQT